MQLSEYLYDTIGRFVSLTEAEKYFVARCPFHNEETPSFTVNPQTNVYHCFGCDAHGHVEDFQSDLSDHRAMVGM